MNDNCEHDIVSPFTDEQVESINEYQKSGVFHDFTCPNCGSTLRAKNKGLNCPKRSCRYTQNWVHPFMADDSWKKGKKLMEESRKNAENYED